MTVRTAPKCKAERRHGLNCCWSHSPYALPMPPCPRASPQYCSMGTTTEMKSSVSTMVEVTGFLASVSALVLYVRWRLASALREMRRGRCRATCQHAREQAGGDSAQRWAALHHANQQAQRLRANWQGKRPFPGCQHPQHRQRSASSTAGRPGGAARGPPFPAAWAAGGRA